MCLPRHMPLYQPHVIWMFHVLYNRSTCHPCNGDMCHSLINPPVPIHVSIHCILPCQLYSLYSQLPHGTEQTIQSTLFCLFGQMNRPQYLENTTSIWSYSSFVGFVSMRPMHTSILKPLWVVCVLGLPRPILVLRSNSGSPTRGIQALRKPKLGIFFQNYRSTWSYKDNEYALQGPQFKCIMISKPNQ